MFARRVFHNVFVEHQVICGLQQGIEANIDFGLTGSAHFMMLGLNRYAEVFQKQSHFAADILQRIIWRDREVALFDAHAVSEVCSAVTPGVPGCLIRIDLSILKVAGIGNAGATQVFLGFFRDIAWVAAVRFLTACRAWMGDITHQAQSRYGGEWVHDSRVWIGNDQHIALIDCLEPTNAGTVKSLSFDKGLFLKFAHWDAEMLPGAWHINELEVYHACAALSGKLQYLFRGHILSSPSHPIPAPLLEYFVVFAM